MEGGNNICSINRLALAVRLRQARASERGASMVEYGLLIVFVFLVAFVSVRLFGESVVAMFDSGTDSFDAGTSGN